MRLGGLGRRCFEGWGWLGDLWGFRLREGWWRRWAGMGGRLRGVHILLLFLGWDIDFRIIFTFFSLSQTTRRRFVESFFPSFALILLDRDFLLYSFYSILSFPLSLLSSLFTTFPCFSREEYLNDIFPSFPVHIFHIFSRQRQIRTYKIERLKKKRARRDRDVTIWISDGRKEGRKDEKGMREIEWGDWNSLKSERGNGGIGEWVWGLAVEMATRRRKT